MSQANVEYLLKNNLEISSNTIEVCPNSIDPFEIQINETKIQSSK